MRVFFTAYFFSLSSSLNSNTSWVTGRSSTARYNRATQPNANGAKPETLKAVQKGNFLFLENYDQINLSAPNLRIYFYNERDFPSFTVQDKDWEAKLKSFQAEIGFKSLGLPDTSGVCKNTPCYNKDQGLSLDLLTGEKPMGPVSVVVWCSDFAKLFGYTAPITLSYARYNNGKNGATQPNANGDKHKDCAQYGLLNYCLASSEHAPWMKVNCPKTCGSKTRYNRATQPKSNARYNNGKNGATQPNANARYNNGKNGTTQPNANGGAGQWVKNTAVDGRMFNQNVVTGEWYYVNPESAGQWVVSTHANGRTINTKEGTGEWYYSNP